MKNTVKTIKTTTIYWDGKDMKMVCRAYLNYLDGMTIEVIPADPMECGGASIHVRKDQFMMLKAGRMEQICEELKERVHFPSEWHGTLEDNGHISTLGHYA